MRVDILITRGKHLHDSIMLAMVVVIKSEKKNVYLIINEGIK
jgi:hypothetical protein